MAKAIKGSDDILVIDLEKDMVVLSTADCPRSLAT